MRQTLLSFSAIGFFALLLVGTSKPKEDDSTSTASSATSATAAASASSAPAPVANASIPDATSWPDTTVKGAKVVLKIPKGAKVPAERAGSDPTIGPYFTVMMPSGYGVYVKTPRKPDTINDTKSFYTSHARGSIQVIYDSNDALVANRKESGPAGAYCEVTACSPAVHGKPMCVEGVGATISSSTVTKLTADECLDVVAMVRSIKAAP